MHARHGFASPSPTQSHRDVWARVARGLRSLLKHLSREHRARRAVEHLSALDDRMLKDIGMDRGSIGYAARHGSLPREHAPLGLRSTAVSDTTRHAAKFPGA